MIIMLFLITLFLTTLVYAAPECVESNLYHGFSECLQNNTRTAYYYWKDECDETSLTLPAPVGNLDCLLPCEAGTFLDLDPDTQRSKCTNCPANTYNIGGGVRFAGFENDWENMEQQFTSYCWTSGWLTWHMGLNCTEWSVVGNGEAVTSGETTNESWVESQLIYYDHLVTNGTLTVSYSKDSRVLNGFNNGEFSIYVNGNRKHVDNEIGDNMHTTKVIELEQGKVEIIIVYEKYNDPESKDLNAQVDYFELRGTAHSSHACYDCKVGFSKEGSSSCNLCEAGYYYEVYEGEDKLSECLPCGEEEYSTVGSIGRDSCKPKRPCNKDDYSYTWSNCIDDVRTKHYFWNQPHVCSDSFGVSLPPEEPNHLCATCNPGHYHAIINGQTKEAICKPCDDGTYLTETTEVVNSCQVCGAGSFAPKALNYTTWTGQTDFTNYCRKLNGGDCAQSKGFIENGEELTTGSSVEDNVDLILTRSVIVTKEDAYIEVQLSLENFTASTDSYLSFSIDGILTKHFNANTSNEVFKLPIKPGKRVLKWVFRHKDDSDVLARIHRIVVYGVDDGAAASCEKCPIGTISTAQSSKCEPCGPGLTSNDDHTQCVECEGNTYNDEVGNPLGCMHCPAHSVSNRNKTTCLGHEILNFSNYTVYIKNLTGIEEGLDGYNQGICMRERLQLFCRDTFYGPIQGEDNFFYLSVLNPSNFELPQYGKVDDLYSGYAYGVINKTYLSISEDYFNTPDEVCVSDFEKLVVNLGSRIEYINKTSDGFSIRYTDGAPCDLDGTEKYKTDIRFECDKHEGDGWPMFVHRDACKFTFRWKTAFACKICDTDDMEKIEGSCYDGQRTISEVEGKECIVLNGTSYSERTEECSVTSELMKSWPVIIGLVSLVVLTLLAGIFFFCFCRIKAKYQRLMEDRDDEPQGRQIELS